jgi:hypothetical protein
MKNLALALIPLLSVPATAAERLRVHVREQGVSGTFVTAGHGEAESVKHLQKRLSKTFDIASSIQEADFGVIVMGRGKGVEELQARGFDSVGSAEERVSPAADPPRIGGREQYWLAVDVWSPTLPKQRFIAIRPATVGVYDDLGGQIARNVREWAKANAQALIAARADKSPGANAIP